MADEATDDGEKKEAIAEADQAQTELNNANSQKQTAQMALYDAQDRLADITQQERFE